MDLGEPSHRLADRAEVADMFIPRKKRCHLIDRILDLLFDILIVIALKEKCSTFDLKVEKQCIRFFCDLSYFFLDTKNAVRVFADVMLIGPDLQEHDVISKCGDIDRQILRLRKEFGSAFPALNERIEIITLIEFRTLTHLFFIALRRFPFRLFLTDLLGERIDLFHDRLAVDRL